MKVNEIFLSWQGEGHHTGMPAVFVRFAGCNLSCDFCDTDHEHGKKMSAKEVWRQVEQLTKNNGVRMVVLTGGEPLLQNDLCKFIYHDFSGSEQLLDWEIHLETNGTLWQSCTEDVDWLVCSPKRGAQLDKKIFACADEIKFVVEFDADWESVVFEPVIINASRLRLYKLSFQPCDYHDIEKNKLALEKAQELSLRYGRPLSVQMHKLIGIR